MQAVDRPAHPHRDCIAVTRKVDQFIRRQRLLIDAVNEHVQVVLTKQVITHLAAIQLRGHLGRNRQIVYHRNPIGSVLLEPKMPQALEHDLRYRRLIQRRLKGSVQAGHPLLLLQEHATVTVCHSRTRDIADVLRGADVIVAAVGVPAFIKPEMVKEGVVIVDVGINATENGLVGDVDPAVAAKAGAFTPVPGGIGVVSNMMVMDMLSRNL